jgi:hypothetical protein
MSKSSLMQKEFTDEQRATMGSLNSLAGSLFFSLISVMLGLVADQVGPTKALLGLQGFSLIQMFIYGRLVKEG